MASGGVYHDLLSRCVDILESYDPETMGVDTHTEIYLSSKLPSDYEESSVTLVTEVFAGCVQYNKLLQVVNDTFHSKDGRNFKKHDAHLFRVIAYLAIFRLEELGMAHFRRFVTSQPVSKMHKVRCSNLYCYEVCFSVCSPEHVSSKCVDDVDKGIGRQT
jgi:hypothetical protein